jgi:hypothetical protein
MRILGEVCGCGCGADSDTTLFIRAGVCLLYIDMSAVRDSCVLNASPVQSYTVTKVIGRNVHFDLHNALIFAFYSLKPKLM